MSSHEISETIQRLATEFGPAVVGLGRGWGRGSGVVVADGLVLTVRPGMPGRGPRGPRGHHHGPPVARTPEAMARGRRGHDDPAADGVPVVMADGRVVDGHLAGTDPTSPLAVIAVDTAGITPVVVADVPTPGIGTGVVALGNPGGRGLRVTAGYVSAEPHTMPSRRVASEVVGIEHTAPLPHGSSGGPLLDIEGRLLGVNALRPAPGLILAVATGANILERIHAIAEGTVPRPRELGVAVAPAQVARRMRRAVGLPDVDGVLVREVISGGIADRAGVLAGDLITVVGGQPIDGIRALAGAIAAAPAGTPIDITLMRGSETVTTTGTPPRNSP